MADHNNKPVGQFVLSHELLLLLRWLVDHDEEKIKKIIAKACLAGFNRTLDAGTPATSFHHSEELQATLIDFFGMLEDILAETLRDQARVRAQQQNLIPALEKIDQNECDDETIQHSITKATNTFERDPSTNPKDQLFLELLKRWKPQGKIIMN